jgi:predicted neuraminidase
VCRAAAQPAVLVRSEFIYDQAPIPQCHASNLVEFKSGLVAAWFGGTKEGNPDVGICVSRLRDGKRTPVVEVARAVADKNSIR